MKSMTFIFVCLFVTYVVTQDTTTNAPIEMSCGEHQVYSLCHLPCERSCFNPNPECLGECTAGCFCSDNYFRAPDGTCVLLENCPQPEESIGSIEMSIDECQPDEVFVGCGWCEGSCSDPVPDCPNTTCTRGCLCRPPLLRHYTGHCVEQKHCLPQNCSDRNEEYTCRYGCEVRCERTSCLRPRRCFLGCHCKRGLYRNRDGQCVTYEQCFDAPNIYI